MSWANRLTIFRIILVPVFIANILYHRLDIAFVIFVLASLTDGLDGYLARVRNERTNFGTIMDPIADKLLVNSAYICFSLVTGLPEYLKMPIYVPIIVISRDAFILIGAVVIYLTTGSISVKPTVLGKVTTFFQMLTIILMLLRFVYSAWIWNAMVFMTVVSGIDYIRKGTRVINGH